MPVCLDDFEDYDEVKNLKIVLYYNFPVKMANVFTRSEKKPLGDSN